MLAEFLSKIRELAGHDNTVNVVRTEGLHRSVIVQQGGDRQTVPLDPPLRAPVLGGYGDLLEAALNSDICPNPEVYHCEASIVLLCDRADRLEKVEMPMGVSERFKTLKALEFGKSFTPAEAVRFLRFELHGTKTEEVTKHLSRINFDRASGNASDIGHGKESLGRSVEAKVQQADKIPESFDVEVSIYTNPGLEIHSKAKIKVGVFLDMAASEVVLQTLSDECAKAEGRVQEAIGVNIRSRVDGKPVFYGRP